MDGKAYQREWRAKNKDRIQQLHKTWLEKNRERVHQLQKAWRIKNHERLLEKQRAKTGFKIRKKNCKLCQSEFSASRSDKIYCSDYCGFSFRNKKKTDARKTERFCAECGVSIGISHDSRRKYCDLHQNGNNHAHIDRHNRRLYHKLLAALETRGTLAPGDMIKFEALSEVFGRDCEEWLPQKAAKQRSDMLEYGRDLRTFDEEGKIKGAKNEIRVYLMEIPFARFFHVKEWKWTTRYDKHGERLAIKRKAKRRSYYCIKETTRKRVDGKWTIYSEPALDDCPVVGLYKLAEPKK